MTEETVLRLMDRFEAGGIARLEYRDGASRLVLEKQSGAGAPAPAAQSAAVSQGAAVPAAAAPKAAGEDAGARITAPVVGSFYRAPDPQSAAFVQPGDKVQKGQTVAIIEAMKMITEVPAPCDGVIGECFAEDGALVGFGQPLFSIREM